MSTTTVPAMSLPGISEVDRADEKLGSFMSDLDSLTSDVEAFAGNDISLADAFFMDKSGIAFSERPRFADPAVVARLLVFADETLEAADTIRDNATKLRRALLTAYRYYVIEPSGRQRHNGGGDDG